MQAAWNWQKTVRPAHNEVSPWYSPSAAASEAKYSAVSASQSTGETPVRFVTANSIAVEFVWRLCTSISVQNSLLASGGMLRGTTRPTHTTHSNQCMTAPSWQVLKLTGGDCVQADHVSVHACRPYGRRCGNSALPYSRNEKVRTPSQYRDRGTCAHCPLQRQSCKTSSASLREIFKWLCLLHQESESSEALCHTSRLCKGALKEVCTQASFKLSKLLPACTPDLLLLIIHHTSSEMNKTWLQGSHSWLPAHDM